MNIKATLVKLKTIKLSEYPVDDIKNLFNEFGILASIVVHFHPGKSIMRARPNSEKDRFEMKKDYSFKPQEFNTTYQRASTPNQTMFYGTVVPDKLEEGELNNMRIIGVAETIPMLRDITKSGYQKISFGRWVVVEDLNLIAIVQKDDFYGASNYTRELSDAYQDFLRNIPADIAEKSLEISNFLANEFAKGEINNHSDYLISALFSELVTKKGYDGILYPSVRVAGHGFNIAITPEATKKLDLRVAGECSIYKVKDHTIIGNDAIVELNGDEDEFKLIKIENHQQEILRTLGLKSLDELKMLE
jgi:hypothetical protein